MTRVNTEGPYFPAHLHGLLNTIRENHHNSSVYSDDIAGWSGPYWSHVMRNVGKMPLSHIQTDTLQMSVRIRAVWSGHSLLVDICYSIRWLNKRTTKALISLNKCAGWSGPALSAKLHKGPFLALCINYTCTLQRRKFHLHTFGQLSITHFRLAPFSKRWSTDRQILMLKSYT